MSKFFACLFILFCLLPAKIYASTSSSEISARSVINPIYEVPNHKAAADLLLKKLKLLKQRSDEVRKSSSTPKDVDDLLEDLFLPNNWSEFNTRYNEEVLVARSPKDQRMWYILANKYLNNNHLEDAATAAYKAYDLAKYSRDKANALMTMSTAYEQQGKLIDALNLANRSVTFQDNRQTRKRLDVLTERLFLVLRDVSVNNEQKVPNACLVFSSTLDESQQPEDYVSVKNIQDIDIYRQDNKICLHGLDYGRTYTVDIRKGLRGTNNTIMDHDAIRNFTVKDRQSRVNFEQGTYVLSRSTDNVVPLTSVNIDKLELSLHLIHDRNLIHAERVNLFQKLNTYQTNSIEYQSGSLIWKGEMDVKGKSNVETKTLVPIDDIMGKKQHGIYILTARPPKKEGEDDWRYNRRQFATQWILVSDMGIMSLKGQDGLHVMIRSLKTADPLSNVTVKLVANNNKILGTTKTNDDGFAKFPAGLMRGKGGDSARLITAEGDEDDYNFLFMYKSTLDLSDRGIAGKEPTGKHNAFMYTDRGVYRPGETVKLSALLRDTDSKAIKNLPITFRIQKPDGSILKEELITGDDLGGYQLDIPISAAAIPGQYSADVYLEKPSSSFGYVDFQVQDFVPQRIRAKLKTDLTWMDAAQPEKLNLQADFLYGAPAKDLKVESHLSLKKNPVPFADYKKFRFGLVEDDFFGKTLSPQTHKTDAQGKAVIDVKIDDLPDTSNPLLVYVNSSVFDIGGRPVNARIAIPLRTRDVEVGLRQTFSGRLEKGDEATFQIVALDKDGKPIANRKIDYELVKEDYYYTWFRSGNSWNSQQNIYDTAVTNGEITTDQNGLANISHAMENGRFRINIQDQDGSSAASQRFYVGWWSRSTRPNVPDELELSLKNKRLNDGDLLKAFIKAPFAGKAIIMVVNDQIRLSQNIDLPAEGREIDVLVDKDWGPGAYLSVTAFRPDAGKISKLPVRSMGLAWFDIDHDRRSAKITIDTPKTVIPRQTLTLPVKAKGINLAGKKMKLTIAAVDEGILGLTGFESPDPIDHFLGQRRLSLDIADLYGRLIKPVLGIRGKIRTGGDSALRLADTQEIMVTAAKRESDENATGVQTKTVKTVALFHKDIQLDENGEGSVTLDLPDFNGRLRLMTVSYGEDVVGHGESHLIVRDPVVANVSLPRFLSPGDQAQSILSLHNLGGEKRRFEINLDHNKGLSIDGQKSITVDLENNKRFEQALSLSADMIGDSQISLTVKSDGLPDIERSWDIAVRPAQQFVTKRQVAFLNQGESTTLSRDQVKEFLQDTVKTSLSLTDRPDFNVPALLDSLSLYPYGCAEQTTSRALPLLYFADVAQSWGKEYDPLNIQRKMDKAIRRLLNMQKADGSFGVWRATGETHPWLTAYVFEFLSRAQERNYHVPKAAYNLTREWLADYVNDRKYEHPHVMAYAHYVLARLGDIQPSEVRYFADQAGQNIRTRMGFGHLAAALTLTGEQKMAEDYFARALRTSRDKILLHFWDYGSDLRDGAALAALMAEAAPNSKRLLKISAALEKEFDRRQYFSTQEEAWLLLATHALSHHTKDGFQVAIDDKEIPVSTKTLRYQLTSSDLEKSINIKNLSRHPIRAIQSYRAVPRNPLPPVRNGFEITRSFFTTTGEKVDLNNIKQNDLIVVVIQGRSLNRNEHEGLVVDMLPAGFEIENAVLGGFEVAEQKNFIPAKTNFIYEAARDDRYVAAMNLDRYYQDFATSYVVRAVTPGTFSLPAVFVEDMYKPQYHARGAVGQVTIKK